MEVARECKQFKAEFDRNGFVVIPSLLPPNDFAELRQNLDRYIREVVPGLPDVDAFYERRDQPDTLKQLQRMNCDPYFASYCRHPRWVALAEALLGERASAEPPEWFNKPPRTNHVTPPHQDNYYFCLTPPSVLTVWLALDDVDTENGCLRFVTGSHLRGYRSHCKSRILGFSQGINDYAAEDFVQEVAVPVRAGDALVHAGMTIHRADANISTTRQRRSFAMVFKGVSCQRDEAAYGRYRAAAHHQRQELGLKT
ncbi:MAG TPA: phytanoyl-CoA dioxygenase family protein [Pirellulales bacterium]|jgi:phytanoyl-CoA hydroxylase